MGTSTDARNTRAHSSVRPEAVFHPLGNLERFAEQNHLGLQFMAIFQSSYDGIWIMDGQGIVLRLNPASERINAVTSAEIVGRHITELVALGVLDRTATMEVLEKKRPVTVLQKALRTGKKLLVTGTPIFDQRGRIIMVVCNDRDITDLDYLRHKLLESEARTERFQEELLKREMEDLAGLSIIGRSPEMRRILAAAGHVAPFNTNVLLSGASGSGKSLLARVIHQLSSRKERPFVRVDCGSLPSSLFESEVFGYETGAFTGARTGGKMGLFEMAHGGTLFLDEIASVPLFTQHKLLRFMESGEIVRVGATRPVNVDARLIAATNVSLEDMVRAGSFRKDLYYRLNVVPLTLPPLKERVDDVPLLVRHFLPKFNHRFGTDKSFSGPAIEALMAYDWPGNIRELENLVERLVVMTVGSVIESTDLPSNFSYRPELTPRLPQGQSLAQAVREYEQALIDTALHEYGTQARAAQALGVSQSTVARKRNAGKVGRRALVGSWSGRKLVEDHQSISE